MYICLSLFETFQLAFRISAVTCTNLRYFDLCFNTAYATQNVYCICHSAHTPQSFSEADYINHLSYIPIIHIRSCSHYSPNC